MNKIHNSKLPPGNGHNEVDPEAIRTMIRALQHADKHQLRKLSTAYLVLFITAFGFIVACSLAHPRINSIGQLLMLNVIIVAVIIAALLLRKKYLAAHRLDYGSAVTTMLQKAEQRYRFWNREWILIIVLILVVNMLVSGIFQLVHLPEHWSPLERTFIAQSLFLPLLAAAFLVEWVNWKNHQKPVWKKLQRIIKQEE